MSLIERPIKNITSNMESSNYVGRYAPSPTGSLHFGNLRTALLAWLHARLHQGRFLLRMEDLDTPRMVPGADQQILHDLEWLGLDWDETVIYQSNRTKIYQAALTQLKNKGLIYPCFCSRKDIQQLASAPHGKTGVYPGTCANLSTQEQQQRARLKSPASRVRVQGEQAPDGGDFVVHRADGLFAYQLAVVVDDLAQGVTHIVRGADLASSADRQWYLASVLAPDQGLPSYHHAPLMLDKVGNRMAKRDGSQSVAEWRVGNRSSGALVSYLLNSLNTDWQLPDSLTPNEALKLISPPQLDAIFIGVS